MLEKLHHIAFRCRDRQETVDFYTKVIGRKYAAAVLPPEGRKAYGEPCESLHIFFEFGDGTYLAFFDVASSPSEQCDPNTPWWVKHLAFEVPSMEPLEEGRRRLLTAGYNVLGPKDHGFCQSIYFLDPNEHRVEMACCTEKAGELDDMARAAPHLLAE
jgi:catechol 2,3-dioxygenase-like lactoylglutathione lyase family enzyme